MNVGSPEGGEKTGAQEMEMWAHYFSFSICGDTEAVDEMKKYFPETVQQYERIVSGKYVGETGGINE